MRILVSDGGDAAGVGGALRGQEMAYALHSLGHKITFCPRNQLLVDYVGKREVDAVIVTGTWHQLVAENNYVTKVAEASDAAGIPCIWWYGSNGSVFGSCNPDPARRKADEQRIIELICSRKFIAAICPYSIGIYERHGVPREKMRLVPSVFDGDLFAPAESRAEVKSRFCLRFKFGIPDDAPVIGTVGNTPNSKGGDDVLRAMALLKDMPGLHYLILHTPEANLSKVRSRSPDGLKVGKSEFDVLQDSKQLAQGLGIADRVHFAGMRFPRDAMPKFYHALDAYCSPSKAENLGQPLVESQLCGLPLVTYKGFSFDFVACPDTADQIEPSGTVTDDYGLVIPECDAAVLAGAIRRALQKKSARTMEVTRAWAYAKFHHHNARIMVKAIEEYRALLQGVSISAQPKRDEMAIGYEAAADRIEIELKGKPAGLMLDVGCSTGAGMAALARRWPESSWVGIEPQSSVSLKAHERGFAVRIGVVEAMAFPDASFDFIFARHALEHATDRAQAISEICRVLKPGGRFYVQAPIEPDGSRNVLHLSAFRSLEELRLAFQPLKELYWGPQPAVGELILEKAHAD